MAAIHMSTTAIPTPQGAASMHGNDLIDAVLSSPKTKAAMRSAVAAISDVTESDMLAWSAAFAPFAGLSPEWFLSWFPQRATNKNPSDQTRRIWAISDAALKMGVTERVASVAALKLVMEASDKDFTTKLQARLSGLPAIKADNAAWTKANAAAKAAIAAGLAKNDNASAYWQTIADAVNNEGLIAQWNVRNTAGETAYSKMRCALFLPLIVSVTNTLPSGRQDTWLPVAKAARDAHEKYLVSCSKAQPPKTPRVKAMIDTIIAAAELAASTVGGNKKVATKTPTKEKVRQKVMAIHNALKALRTDPLNAISDAQSDSVMAALVAVGLKLDSTASAPPPVVTAEKAAPKDKKRIAKVLRNAAKSEAAAEKDAAKTGVETTADGVATADEVAMTSDLADLPS